MKYLILIVALLVIPGCVSAQRAHEMSNAELLDAYHRTEGIAGFPDMNVAREIHARGGMTDDWLASLEAGNRFPKYTPGEQEFLTWYDMDRSPASTAYGSSGAFRARSVGGRTTVTSGGIPVRVVDR